MADVDLLVQVQTAGVPGALQNLKDLRKAGMTSGEGMRQLATATRAAMTNVSRATRDGSLSTENYGKAITETGKKSVSLKQSLSQLEREYRRVAKATQGLTPLDRLTRAGEAGGLAAGKELARTIQLQRAAFSADPVRDLIAVEREELALLEQRRQKLAAIANRQSANTNISRAREDLANEERGLNGVQRATIQLTRAKQDLARAEAARKATGISNTDAQRTAALNAEAQAIRQVASAQRDLRLANEAGPEQNQNAFQSSFSYFIIAGLAQQVSQRIIEVGGAAITASAEINRSFADVDRTFEGTSTQLGSLRQKLVELSTSTPNSFTDLAEIATLGNQLGIAAEDIESFTTVIARYTAVSGQSAEDASTAFGRISNLTGLAASQYSNLASAITYVARTTVATESTIQNTAKEITALSSGAGFSAQSIVGLAGALSSLAIPPERARGALSLYFGALNTAVAQGGPKLAAFAELTGKTADELNQLVRANKGEEVFTAFVSGLSELDTVAKTSALKTLGLSTIRVDQTMRALAQNVPLVTKSFEGANKAFDENLELSSQYAKIQEQLSSKISEFQNSIQNAAGAIGSAFAPALSELLESSTKIIAEFTEFAGTPFGSKLIEIAAGVAVVVAAMASLIGALSLARASFIVFKFAMSGLGWSTASKGFAGLTASLLSTNAATRSAAFSMTGLRVAMAETTIGARLLAGVKLAGSFAILGLAVTAATALLADMDKQMNYSKFASDSMGASVDELATAMREDNARLFAADVKKTGDAASDANTGVSGLNEAILSAASLQIEAATAVDSTTAALDGQSVALGASTKQWLDAAVLQSDAMKRLLGNESNFVDDVLTNIFGGGNSTSGSDAITASIGAGLDLDKLSEITYTGGASAGVAFYDGWLANLQEQAASGDKTAQDALAKLAGGFDIRSSFVLPLADGIEASKTMALVASAISGAGQNSGDAATQIDTLGNVVAEAGDGFVGASEGFTQFRDNLSSGLQDGLSFTKIFKDLENAAERAKNPIPLSVAGFGDQLSASSDTAVEFFDGLNSLADLGLTSFVTQMAEVGPEASKLVAQAMDLTPEARATLEADSRFAAFLVSDSFKNALKNEMQNSNEAYGQILAAPTGDLGRVKDFIAAQVAGTGAEWERAWFAENPQFPLNIDLINPTEADISALKADLANIQVTMPVKVQPYGPPAADLNTKTYTDRATGKAVTLPAKLDGEALTVSLAYWKENQNATPAEIEAALNTQGFSASVDKWVGENGTVTVNAALRMLPSPIQGPGGNPSSRRGAPAGAYALGGEIPKFASGGGFGMFRGAGSGTSDSLLARVSAGEYINTASSTQFWGPDFFESLNKKMLPTSFLNMLGAAASSGSQAPQTVANVSVVMNNPTTRDPIKQLREDSEMVANGIWGG